MNRNKTVAEGKMYYSISEVSDLTGVEQHVLRYWESEFPKLKPRKNRAGNRQYRDKDIAIIRYVKHLLHNDMYTVQGARKKLMESGFQEVQGQLDLLSRLQSREEDSRGSSAALLGQPAKSAKERAALRRDIKRMLSDVTRELKEIRKLLQ